MKDKLLQRKVVFYVALVLVIIIPVTYAIYKTGILGSGSISLASWNVTIDQSNESNYLSIVPDPNGTTASYRVNITNGSEVNVVYSIVIDNLPSGTSVSLDGGSFVSESNNKVTFSNVGTIPYSDSNRDRSHTVTFKASSGASYVNNQIVDINVVARQTI